MQNGEVKRAVRVAGRVKEELARQLAELRDPRLEGAIVSRVEMTDDLQLARVYVRGLATLDEKGRKALLKGFEAATPRIRREVTRAVALRYSPNLRFFFDEGQDAETRVAQLLREIDDEKKGAGE
jgi:ribosome-binding factor A